MASNSPASRRNTDLPPKRGNVKAQIFESIAETIKSAAFKTGRKRGGCGGADRGSSAATTPPANGNPDGSNLNL